MTTTETTHETRRPRPKSSTQELRRRLAATKREVSGLLPVLKALVPELLYEGQLQRMYQGPQHFVKGAVHDTGEAVLDVVFVPERQVGAVPALHARWQKWGTQALEQNQVIPIKDKGFTVIEDCSGVYAYWREKQINHVWICLHEFTDNGVTKSGWRYTRSKSIREVRSWIEASRVDSPRLPELPGCTQTQRQILREALVEAIVVFEHVLPAEVMSHQRFIETLIRLWEDAVQYLEGLENKVGYAKAN